MDVNNNSTDENSDVDENKNHDELDEILDDKKDEEGEGDENKNKDEKTEEKFNKNLGTQNFTSEDEYDVAVAKMQERNANMATTLGKHNIDPKTGELKEAKESDEKVEKKTEGKQEPLTEDQQYHRFKARDFQEEFSDSKNYKEEMQVFIRKGRANVDGKPSYALAYAKALRADDKAIPDSLIRVIETQKGKDSSDVSRSATKKIMQSGSQGGSNASSDVTYKTEESFKEASNFANSIALRK